MDLQDRDWPLKEGDAINRKQLHDRFGGGRQGGIEPSRKSPNVFIFSDLKAGSKYGYKFDGWKAGVFHFTGDGQVGDQVMRFGNRAVRDHLDDGRTLRVFEGVRGTVTYVGEFVLDSDPYYFAEAPDRNGTNRQVVVFRLRPLRPNSERTPTSLTEVVQVPIEAHNTDRFTVVGSEEQREAERREQPLVRSFREWLESRGNKVTRLRFNIPGEDPLYCDLFNITRNQLIEAKGLATRAAVRMAIGQLVDYRRWTSPAPRLGVLTPHRPKSDLEALLKSAGIIAVWKEADGFADNAGGEFAGGAEGHMEHRLQEKSDSPN